MLVHSRKKSQVIRINGEIEVMVVEIRGDKVRLGVNAPKNVAVTRPDAKSQVEKPRG